MIGSTWNSLFVTVAMATGMFAQQVAHKFSAASEDRQVGSVAGLELFCSAEGYYLAGHFQPPAAKSETTESPPPPAESNDTPAMIAAEPQPADASEPAAEPAAPALEPEAVPNDSAPSAPAAEAAPAEPVADIAADMPEAPTPEPAEEASLSADATEVLPPPTPEKEPHPAVGQFGAFDEDSPHVAPPRTPSRAPLPATIALPGDRTYPDVAPADAGRYVSPAELVRERAVERGEQRRQRIETRKWLGVVPLRPSVAANPYTTVEEPQQLILVVPHVSARVQP